jgi:glutamyl-tRNA synthetase/glutamyl-Q tRNA(Asp) synthetase
VSPDAVTSRYAPAPTGYLHLGHVLNAIYVWGATDRLQLARAGSSGGRRVLLRIEDHDAQRSRRIYEDAILEDLGWLGFEADGPPVRQSDRRAVYERALDVLRVQGLVYACACSRRDLQETRAGQPAREPRYPGTCRDRRLTDERGLSLRVRLAPTIERFVDLRHGTQEQRPAEQCGDLLVRDREGNWTYQFAAAVDDLDQGVTLVVRGADLLESTGRQIAVARLLGRAAPPLFLHHPLLMKSPSQKLSKSDGDSGVRAFRERDWVPEDVIGLAAARAGLIPSPRAVSAADVSSLPTVPARRS